MVKMKTKPGIFQQDVTWMWQAQGRAAVLPSSKAFHERTFFFFFTAEQYTCWNLALTEQLSIMWYWKYLLAIWKLVVTLPALLKWVFPYLLAITWKHRSILSSAKCLNLKQNSCFKGTSVMENLSVSHGGSNAVGAGWGHWAAGGWWTQSIAVK